jgi:hypothetical protein
MTSSTKSNVMLAFALRVDEVDPDAGRLDSKARRESA